MNFLVRTVLNFLYRFRHKPNNQVRRVLFLFPSSAVGDTVIETFFIHEIKTLYPQAQLEVAILAPYAVLLENNSDISHIYKMPIKIHTKLVWLALKSFVFRYRHYDLLLDLPHNGYAPFRQILLYFMGANKTLSCNTDGYNFITYPLKWTEEVPQHITQEVYVKALKMLGATGPFEVKYYLSIPPETEKKIVSFLVEHNPKNKKILVFNPEGSKLPRNLTNNRVEDISNLLVKNTDYQVVILAYKKHYKSAPTGTVIYYTKDLTETVALIAQADYVLTVDTGVLHIADAFNKPMTVLFSEANIDDSPRPYVEYVWGSKNPNTRYLKARHSVNDIEPFKIIEILKNEEYYV